MNSKLKRVWSGVVAFGAAASSVLVLSAPAAYAAGTLSGAATVKNSGGAADLTTGNSDTTFTLRLPAGAACPGDSPNDGYRWQTYMVPSSVDPGTLTFGSTGPTPAGVGASFRQPLYAAVGSARVVNQQTPAADTPGGPGLIINIPDVSLAVFGPGDIPAGTYNVGIACTLGGASATQMKNYWNVPLYFTTDATTGGPAQVAWSTTPPAAAPPAPTGVAVTPGDTTLSVAFTPVTANPAVSGYTATATAGASTFTGTSTTGSPITITSLTNGTTYQVTVRATNSAGSSPESAAVPGTPTAGFGTLNQTLTVTVPAGALSFTQVCGKHNAITPASGDTFGPGAGSAPGSGPVLSGNASPVANCALALGDAAFAPGQNYSLATGILNQVTVTDTRQTFSGWHVNGIMADLTKSPTPGTISGNQLGWRPQATALNGQTVGVDDANPGTSTGLGSPRRLGYVAAEPAGTGVGLGSVELDARVRLQIPLNTPAGAYTGTLSLTLLSGAVEARAKPPRVT